MPGDRNGDPVRRPRRGPLRDPFRDQRREPSRDGSGDPYRDAVRAMSAVEHFGTDYRPVGADRCLCDVEPGVFEVFTFAVLAMHQVRHTRSRRPACGCGEPADTCPVRSLADGLLFAVPDPLPGAP